MTWYDATKKGDEYVWGKNWRTPKLDEVYGEGKLNCKDDETGFKTSVAGSPSFELKEQGGYQTVVFTGVQPGYTKNTLTLYDQIKSGTHNFDFWTASDNKPSAGQEWGVRFAVTVYESNNEFAIVYFGPYSNSDYKDRKYLVRPVLVE